MAGLTDMEELLGRIPSGKVAEFMREALTCYGAGAYRACIVLTYIALFEDLRLKTKTLAAVSSTAKTVSVDIEKLAEGQKPFETDLVNKLLGANLITALQAQRLKQIIDHRNKAAHPSGLQASAEEARFVFFEAIDKYLSQPVLSTTTAVDRILDDMSGGNYFPTSSMSDIKAIVSSELQGIHEEAYPYLIVKLLETLDTGGDDVSRSARFFLTGLSSLKLPKVRPLLYEKLIKGKCTKPAYGLAILSSLSADAELLKFADPATKTRLNTLIGAQSKATPAGTAVTTMRHPLNLLGAMTKALTAAELLPDFAPMIDIIVDTYWPHPELLDAASKSEAIRAKVLAKYGKTAGSSQFATANAFAELLPAIDAKLAKLISASDALGLIASVCRAADIGAFSAKDIQKDHFKDAPKVLKKAAQMIENQPKDARQILKANGFDLSLSKFKNEFLGL